MRLRSLLFVPADRPERFAKAAASGADAIILDLEDSVALSRKAVAREAVRAALQDHTDVVRIVRINPIDSGWLDDDLAAARGADAIMLPKATGDNFAHALDAEHLQFLMQADNTKLSHLEKGNPSLRR